MTLLILYFLISIVISFVCSLTEAVVLSLTYAHVGIMVEQGRKCGLILQDFKEKIDHPLSAILTLNTVAHTIGAAGVGAQVLTVFGNQYVAVASAILTLCILVFSEIIPKTLGAVYWKQLAPAAAFIVRGMIILTYPLVLVFEILGRSLASSTPTVRVTREEMVMAAEMGRAEGQLMERERRVIRNLLHLNTIPIREILTPRSVLFALPKDETVDDTLREHAPIRFSRIPVYGDNLDDIIGLVRRYQLNEAVAKGLGDQPVGALVHPISVVPGSKSVADVLDEFIQKREHIFLVVDEYGGTTGIITLEDAIETLLGVEIVDELDSVVDMQKFALEQWEKKRNKMKKL
jgi:CBS domain containing-hemolysin-like protein